MTTIKKSTSRLYKIFGRFSRIFIAPVLSFLFGGVFFFYIGKFTHSFVLSKTSSNGWAWLAAIVAVIVLAALGAANDRANAENKDHKRKVSGKHVTRRQPPPTAPNPLDPGSGHPPPALPHI